MQGKSSDFAKLNPQVSIDVTNANKLNPNESIFYIGDFSHLFIDVSIQFCQAQPQIIATHFHESDTKELFCFYFSLFF